MLKDKLRKPGRTLIANAPEGLDAVLLGQLAQVREGRPVLHVTRDDARMALLAESLAFFAPETEVVRLPAWDCLPYDRVSPHRDIVAERLSGLARLLDRRSNPGIPNPGIPNPGGLIVLTTVNALLQRVPPRAVLTGRSLSLGPGEALPGEQLNAFLSHNGYLRVETVGEPGEFALRGGIVDVFPASAEQPLRLDFFGDELESIRTFDPLTQISSGAAERLLLRPVGEVLLEDSTIQRFRGAYRAAFGAIVGEDPLYEAISEGRPHPGMEHWLPLFYDQLETLLDYLPDAPITLDHQVEEARNARLEMIADFYEARRVIGVAQAGASVYKPLPPERLYLDAEAWDRLLAKHPVGLFSPFDAPEHLAGAWSAGGRRARDFADARAASEGQLYKSLAGFVAEEQGLGHCVLIAGYSAGSRDRLGHVLVEHGFKQVTPVDGWAAAKSLPEAAVGLIVLGIERGFGWDDATLISEQDVLGDRIARARTRRRRPENYLTEVSALAEGDYVVHVDHGIGQYEGLEALDVGGAPHDCVKVRYYGGDRLYVPVENIEVLSRYGSQDSEAELDRLGQGSWQARKARVKQRIQEAAEELIRIAAAREMKQTEAMLPPEGLYDEFCARFPYPETEDQLRAIAEVTEDLAEGRPMDRLVCGDVGFGKTEVALRAAFVAVMTGRQVAVVVPTTLLARQHYRTFRERFAGLPVRIAQLSRLVGARETGLVKQGLKDGQVDILIGTHAVLGKSVEFKDLGLLIVDEEQHFGVKQKERLKALRADVHVLTLTATPIPRTLQLAMSGVKEMSLIATPPVDRLAVRTFVLPYDPVVVREAIMREHFRGGQTFYVCPRIEDLEGLEERLRALVPEVKLGVAHGRLSAGALEDVMTGFVDHRFDVLLSTNIVESGLDIPAANTMIIHRADMFGLAQLYQLRGRIGRSKQRGYAYLTLPPGRLLSTTAEKRLHVMQTLDTLGAGFTLASHDMDIRGAGNLLGEEQSGHVREVGIELYQQLLEEAVANARAGGEDAGEGHAREEVWSPQVNLGSSVLIPERYVPDLHVRMGLYRRAARLVDRAEVDAFAAELIDRFGALPEEVENLLQILSIKHLCRDAGVEKLDAGPKGAVVAFRGDSFANPAGLVGFIQSQPGRVKLRPDHKLVYQRQWDSTVERAKGVRHLLERLAGIAARKAA